MDNDATSDSELSSIGTISPPPETHYVSPPNSQDGTVTPPDDDGPPPAKRRKVERKPRTTQYLDLGLGPEQHNDKMRATLKGIFQKRRKIVVIAGAGISVSAGSRLHILYQNGILTDGAKYLTFDRRMASSRHSKASTN